MQQGRASTPTLPVSDSASSAFSPRDAHVGHGAEEALVHLAPRAAAARSPCACACARHQYESFWVESTQFMPHTDILHSATYLFGYQGIPYARTMQHRSQVPAVKSISARPCMLDKLKYHVLNVLGPVHLHGYLRDDGQA